MCDACWQLIADDEPWCVRCAAENERATEIKWKLPLLSFVGVVGVSGALAYCDWVEYGTVGPSSWIVFLGAGVLVLAIALAIGSESRERKPAIRPRSRERPADHPEPVAHPYRSRLRRARHALAPPVSGKWVAALLTACLAFSALFTPVISGRPRWQEAEIVFGLWWLFGTGVIAAALYSGRPILDDHSYVPPGLFHRRKSLPDALAHEPSTRFSWFDALSLGLDGCAITLVAAFAVLVAWLLVEAVLPALFFVVYLLIVKALTHAVNYRHRAQGKLGRSLLLGAAWSTAYVAPLALLALALHLVWAAHGH